MSRVFIDTKGVAYINKMPRRYVSPWFFGDESLKLPPTVRGWWFYPIPNRKWKDFYFVMCNSGNPCTYSSCPWCVPKSKLTRLGKPGSTIQWEYFKAMVSAKKVAIVYHGRILPSTALVPKPDELPDFVD